MRTVFAALICLATPVAAQDLVFDPAPVEACIGAGGGDECAGLAADACMEASPQGHTTLAMVGCLDLERAVWDGWLGAVYQSLLTRHATEDAAAMPRAPSQKEALRDMQRAWIGFRDAKCGYEASQWGGGSGAGPASVSCRLHETARQMLYLQSGGLGE